MSKFLLFNRVTRPTGKALAEAMGIPSGANLKGHPDVIIRWGSSAPLATKALQINSAESIAVTANKLAALQKMHEAGVPVPGFASLDTVFESFSEGRLKLPIIGRSLYHHSGRDFYFCKSTADVAKAFSNDRVEYFISYIEINREFRVHVIGDKIIKVIEKVESEEGATDKIIRSNHLGWQFKKILVDDTPLKIKQIARAAIKALSLDFGAVDIILDKKNNVYVLECNSAAGLNDIGIDLYADKLNSLIETKNT